MPDMELHSRDRTSDWLSSKPVGIQVDFYRDIQMSRKERFEAFATHNETVEPLWITMRLLSLQLIH
jgi:hypothetical protein